MAFGGCLGNSADFKSPYRGGNTMNGKFIENRHDNDGREIDLLIIVYLFFLICIVFTMFHTRVDVRHPLFEERSNRVPGHVEIE